MHELVRSWVESLGYLKPSSLKQWGLLTLKKSAAAYVTLGVNSWLLLIVVGAFLLLLVPVVGVNTALSWTWLFFLMAWVVAAVLAVRPSLEKKSYSYFVKYLGHSLVALVLLVFFTLVAIVGVFTWIVIVGDWFSHREWDSYFAQCIHSILSQIALFLWTHLCYMVFFFFYLPVIFSLFFLFDNALSLKSVFKSIWWGIKLLAYMLPLCLVVSLVAQIIVEAISWFRSRLNVVPVEYETLFLCLMLPFYFSFLIYIYITQVHSHPEKYEGMVW
ncbi:MAG: hypothetical protein AB7F19_01355 [Candidatus Babeliales bacterium]